MTKKILTSVILCLAFFSISGFAQTYGDVNASGSVDIVDALLTAQFYVGKPLPYYDEIAGDVDGINGITIVDSLLIAQYYVGMIDRFPVEDIQPTPTPFTGTEKIINGDFSNDSMNWSGGFYAPGAGTMSVSGGVLCISITDGGTATWNVQISQGNINLVSGTSYTFSFAARSASARTIEANVSMSADPYTAYFASGSLNLSTTMTTYTYTFTAPSNDATARVEFNCGLAAVDVYIDNVSLIGGPEPTAGPTPEPLVIDYPDPKLEAAIRTIIGKPAGAIYNTDVYTLGTMTLTLLGLTDLSGMEYCSGLTKLVVNYNQNLIGIAPLQSLTSLKDLNIGANNLGDIDALRNLTALTQLNIVVNNISDLSPLSNLTNLTILRADGNNVADLSPLATLTRLSLLTMYENEISDLWPLAYLTNLTYLDLSDNAITDISALASLTKLENLNLCGNTISDITAIGSMTKLVRLIMNVRVLEDITPLARCTNLVYLNLDNNSIRDITPLKDLPNLKDISLLGNPLDPSAQAIVESLRARGVVVFYEAP